MSARTIARHLFLNTDRLDLRNTVSAAEIMGCGTSSTKFDMSTTADTNAFSFYLSSAATSGTTRGLYLRLYLTGGAGGEAARIFCSVSSNTPADTCNGAHISLSYGSSAGNCTRLATAARCTLHVPNRSLGGTCAAVQAELYADGASAAVGGVLSLIRAVVDGDSTGKATIEDGAYLFDISCGTNASGNMVGAAGNEPTWTTNKTYLIRCRVNGTVMSLVAVSA